MPLPLCYVEHDSGPSGERVLCEKYYITSAAGGFPIGRKPDEDKSLNPKGIYKLPLGSESVWDVEKLADGNYRLSNGGPNDIVGGIDRKLLAFLIPEQAKPATTEWTLRLDETRVQDGDAYMITEALSDRHLGWVMPESSDTEPYPQVILGALIVGPRIPPFYPASQVFFFKKVDA
ncbi:hypothetical protein V8D89_004209 [Ganoderma adspersum]